MDPAGFYDALAPHFHLTLGLRYEFAGKPSEVNQLTRFPQGSDTNNFAPRIGLAWSGGATTLRAGYGIAYGSVNSVADLAAHPQLRRLATESPDGTVELVAPPARIAGEAPSYGAVPSLDQHGPEIRREFG